MRTKVGSAVLISGILCLGFLVCGCQSCMRSCLCKHGHERGLEYRNKEIRAYRLVIMLHPFRPSDRDEFLRGFRMAYDEANDGKLGQEYAGILKQSLESGTYEQAFEQGRKHVNREVTDAQAQTMIRHSLLKSRAFALGWEAGYIEGFVGQMLEKDPGDEKENLYRQAETMYNVLSPVIE